MRACQEEVDRPLQDPLMVRLAVVHDLDGSRMTICHRLLQSRKVQSAIALCEGWALIFDMIQCLPPQHLQV